jgi:histone H2B
MAPTTRKSISGKDASKPPTKSPRSRRKPRRETFAIYNYRVLKKVHPDLGISKKGMAIMNDMMQDLFERVAKQAGELTKITHKATMRDDDIKAAVQLLLPRGELLQEAQNAGKKALQQYRFGPLIAAHHALMAQQPAERYAFCQIP